MVLAEELAAIVIAVALVLSTALFGIDVFVKGRGAKGQGIGFTFSLIALPLYFVAFCDRFPGRPTGPRDILVILPGVTKADADFSSSIIILILLVLTYAMRLGIYTRLFIIPALTMTEAEYRAQGPLEERANDLSAPVLAYVAFALIITAIIAGAYALPVVVGAVICVLLLIIYFCSPYLRHLRNSLLWLMVYIRIAAREFWRHASRIVVNTIILIATLELWRRKAYDGDEHFINAMKERLSRSEARAQEGIRREREKLRHLV
jgi:hypothetical protein